MTNTNLEEWYHLHVCTPNIKRQPAARSKLSVKAKKQREAASMALFKGNKIFLPPLFCT